MVFRWGTRLVTLLALVAAGLLPALFLAGPVAASGTGPSITSITITGTVASDSTYVQSPAITLNGSGFDPAPTATSTGYTGFDGLDYGTDLHFSDLSQDPHSWDAGYDNPGAGRHDSIGLADLNYTDTQISYTFGNIYPAYQGTYELHIGDQFHAYVRNVWCTGTVVLGTPIPCGNLSLNPTVTPNPVTLNGMATASAGAVDTLSGIASQGCDPVMTSAVGTFSVNCWAINDAGNSASGTASYTVGYGVCVISAVGNGLGANSVAPIKLTLCDAAGNDVSAPDITLHATGLTDQATGTSYPVTSAGNANPNENFRFDPTLGTSGGYILNLRRAGMPAGSYSLTFTAGSDSLAHTITVTFR